MTLLAMFWILLVCLSGLSVRMCGSVQVTIHDKRKYAMLFQSVVLPCQYSSASSQTPVVQWWYKSYCHDRTYDAFSFHKSLGLHASELGPTSHLDCSDSSRTVRIVASGQGHSLTLSEYYKGRDISIINKADLHIGQLRWGDSGMYYCKVVISDDLEGQNEDHVELLVLGQVGPVDDLLPGFDMDVMPEWLFVAVVLLGGLALILLVGICWCQCCPHSCCCYVRCCCCPDTCCCPRHLYEAGKVAKSMASASLPMHPAFYMPNVPTMVSIAPPSLIESKMAPTPSLENNMPTDFRGYRLPTNKEQDSLNVLYHVEKELAQFDPAKRSCNQSCSMSELSSLHDGEPPFRQTYRQVQKAALPPVAGSRDRLDLQDTMTSQALQPNHTFNRSRWPEDQHQARWKPASEHLQRKTFGARGRTGSLDELEEFALSYDQRRRRGASRELERDHEPEPRSRKLHHPQGEEEQLQRIEKPPDSWMERNQIPSHRKNQEQDWERRGNGHSPPPSPKKRRDIGNGDLRRSRRGREYNDAYLSSLLERKARHARAGRAEDDSGQSDTPSRGSSKKSSSCYHSQSPSNRPDEEDEDAGDEDLPPPYSERSADPAMRPFSYGRPNPGLKRPPHERRDEREKLRKVNTLLSRDSLVV
ncbi:immunoglobulin-like domain-containing receptor 2 isoform X1 [Paramormyrops kingsleyae]|uniref:Immunoglobulin-like domain containing receptor 2 n=1 Tax=Paramormyrops kingsleyae TaxID=1676925 RepID=A0A3B3SC18_9TELE|nr:immunoglobulin-like domain-containing receptor 2 isoform X1 [Paramormyrops kingsleyae]